MKYRLLIIILAAAFLSVSLLSAALAVGPGKMMEWSPENCPGKVSLDGKVHADKGIKCTDCHTKIWPMKKGAAAMKMADMDAGKYCGICHNGGKAFSTSDQNSCTRCHQAQK